MSKWLIHLDQSILDWYFLAKMSFFLLKEIKELLKAHIWTMPSLLLWSVPNRRWLTWQVPQMEQGMVILHSNWSYFDYCGEFVIPNIFSLGVLLAKLSIFSLWLGTSFTLIASNTFRSLLQLPILVFWFWSLIDNLMASLRSRYTFWIYLEQMQFHDNINFDHIINKIMGFLKQGPITEKRITTCMHIE